MPHVQRNMALSIFKQFCNIKKDVTPLKSIFSRATGTNLACTGAWRQPRSVVDPGTARTCTSVTSNQCYPYKRRSRLMRDRKIRLRAVSCTCAVEISEMQMRDMLTGN